MGSATVCAPLAHPLRARILEVANEEPLSPSQFVDAGLMPAEMVTSRNQALSLASYHFKCLAEADCLEVVETIPRRGAIEHIYASISYWKVSDAERKARSLEERAEISRLSALGLIARTENAIREATFDQRLDRLLDWGSLHLGEEGWTKLQDILARTRREIGALREESRGPDGEKSHVGPRVHVTVGLLAFESPPLPDIDSPGS